jgi:outer membrane protein assembly factor BamB
MFVCEYCGTESWVERSSPPESEPTPDTPRAGAQTEDPAGEVEPAPPTRPAKPGRVLGKLAILAAPTGLIVYFVGMQVSWLGQTPVLLHDVNGDQLADPIGFIVSKTEKIAIAALDAQDGDELWRSESLGRYPDDLGGELWRADDWIFFLRETEAPLAFDANTGEQRLELPAMGKIRSVCAADDGVVFVIDGGNRRLHFADGSIDDSVPPSCVPAEHAGFASSSVTTEHSGIARLTDRVDGDIITGPDAAFAVYDVRNELPRITAFELGNGPQRWDKELPRDAPLGAIVPVDDRVYVTIWGTLIVYDAATGDTIFEFGL